MPEVQTNYGLTPIRTARTIASVVALMGMLMLFIERVLAAVLVMAADAVSLGLARYNNFTGRFASENFGEDKQLLALLHEVDGLLPVADIALDVLLVLAIVTLAVALVGLAFPVQFTHVLVALKILKWHDGSAVGKGSLSANSAIENLGNMPLKKLVTPLVVLFFVVILVFAVSSIRSCHAESSVRGAVEDMQASALAYIEAEKAYFAKNRQIGNAKALELADSLSTDEFDMVITATRFSAVSKVPLENCPAGSRWQVVASTKGIFTVELSLYRGVPKDTNCVKLTPDFKKLGRNSKK